MGDPTQRPGLLNLRCVALNDEWELFRNHHIQSEAVRLYANIPSQPPIHPASPRRLNQGHTRLLTPD